MPQRHNWYAPGFPTVKAIDHSCKAGSARVCRRWVAWAGAPGRISSRAALNASKPIIGLTGGIGSGKSTVASIFSDLGAGVIDSDRLAADVLNEADIRRQLRGWWGDAVCRSDGTVNRRYVADIVFADAGARERLSSLIHPRVARMRESRIAVLDRDPGVRVIVVDSPLLVEAGLDRFCDAVVFVNADRAVRLARVRSDRNWTEEEFDRREKSQKPLDIKRERADYIVEGNSGISELRLQVERLLSRILGETRRTS
jgi:dephospho-CoA kinase